MYICERMLFGIPTPETEIQSTYEGKVIVYYNEFLVVCPVESHVSSVLEEVVIRMAHNYNVAVPRRSFWTQGFQSMLSMC
jgi:hypothetical protein